MNSTVIIKLIALAVLAYIVRTLQVAIGWVDMPVTGYMVKVHRQDVGTSLQVVRTRRR